MTSTASAVKKNTDWVRNLPERMAFELYRAGYSFRSGAALAVLVLQIAVFFFAWSKGAGFVYRDMAGPLLLVSAVLWLYTSVVRGNRKILVCGLLLLTVGTMLQTIFLAEKDLKLPGAGITTSSAGMLQVQYMIALAVSIGAGAFYYYSRNSVSRKVCLFLFIMSILLSLTALVYATAVGNVRNWIRIGRISIQTTELVKPVYLIIAAALLGRGKGISDRKIYIFYGVTGIFLTIMALQGEFGTLLLLLMVFFGLLLLFDPNKKRVALTGGLLLAGILVFIVIGLWLAEQNAAGTWIGQVPPVRAFLSPFNKVRNRVVYWLHPELDPQGLGYQLLRAREAIFLGGWLGTASVTDLPVETSDLVYPALIERCGLIFALVVFLLYITLWLEGVRVSVRKEDRVHKVIAAGSAYLLFDQTLIIIAGSTGLCPLTGITLPFISSGGTSLLVSFVLLVLLITASGNVTWKGEDIEEEELSAQSPVFAKLHAGLRHIHAYIHRKDLGHSSRTIRRIRSEKDRSKDKGRSERVCKRVDPGPERTGDRLVRRAHGTKASDS